MTFRIEEEIGTLRSENMAISKMETTTRMASREYIEAAMRTAGNATQKELITNGAMGLCGEAGEVADLVKKWLFQGHTLNTVDLHKEMSDVCWYMAILCKATGTDFETLWEININKLQERYPDGFEVDKSVNREAK